MRKSLLFGAMLLIASCTVQKEEEFENQAQHRYHAVAEEPVDAETRVYADKNLRVRWNEGDRVSIFERRTYNQEYEFLGDNGDTAGDFDPVESSGYHTSDEIADGFVYALYPYDKKNKCDYEGKLTVTFPSTQHYKKDSFGVGANVMVAKTNTMDLRFMHVGGYRTFKLYGEGVSVSSVRIESNGSEFQSGRADVVLSSDGKPEVSFVESSSNSKTVELVCDTPVALGATASEAVEFWFVLPPGTLTQGFTVTITDENGNEFTKSTSNAIEIKSGVKKSMPAFEVEMESVPVIPVPEAIDLGLSLKWASFNLGATSPEEYGDYYAWGETEPKSKYNWSTYKWCMSSNNTIIKYCTDSSCGYNGFTDGKTELDSEDDAAHVNLGGNWRMPSFDEIEELKENCTWEWTTQNGVNGYMVTGPNGNSIFLPAAGYRYSTTLEGAGSHGRYWSPSLSTYAPLRAWHVGFNPDIVFLADDSRYLGFSVRPVYDAPISVESVSLNVNQLNLSVGATTTLVATVLPANASINSVSWSSSDETIATVSSSGVVTAMEAGSAIITVTTADGGKTATCSVVVNESDTSDAVDLGLPSGLKWAKMNIGARNPQELGDRYAWGETATKSEYSWYNYKYGCYDPSDSEYHLVYKYSTHEYNTPDGVVDNKTVLEPDDDAAYVNCGENWRMPRIHEWDELITYCSWTWTTINGTQGYRITGQNDNSIFVPMTNDYSAYYEEYYGMYWSSDLQYDSGSWDDLGCILCFSSSWRSTNHFTGSERARGHYIRPVSDY